MVSKVKRFFRSVESINKKDPRNVLLLMYYKNCYVDIT